MPPAQAFDTAIELLPSANRPATGPGIVTRCGSRRRHCVHEQSPTARGILFA